MLMVLPIYIVSYLCVLEWQPVAGSNWRRRQGVHLGYCLGVQEGASYGGNPVSPLWRKQKREQMTKLRGLGKQCTWVCWILAPMFLCEYFQLQQCHKIVEVWKPQVVNTQLSLQSCPRISGLGVSN